MTDNIRIALESRLAAMTPTLDTAWENKTYTPVNGTPYQISFILFAEPDNSALGCQRRTERGIYQVTLCYPENTNQKAAQDRAELIREHFKRGTVLTSGGQNVLINKTPKKVTLGVMDGRYKVVVSIPYHSQVFS